MGGPKGGVEAQGHILKALSLSEEGTRQGRTSESEREGGRYIRGVGAEGE